MENYQIKKWTSQLITDFCKAVFICFTDNAFEPLSCYLNKHANARLKAEEIYSESEQSSQYNFTAYIADGKIKRCFKH